MLKRSLGCPYEALGYPRQVFRWSGARLVLGWRGRQLYASLTSSLDFSSSLSGFSVGALLAAGWPGRRSWRSQPKALGLLSRPGRCVLAPYLRARPWVVLVCPAKRALLILEVLRQAGPLGRIVWLPGKAFSFYPTRRPRSIKRSRLSFLRLRP